MSENQLSMSGKVAVVTGAAQGIGRAIAEGFAGRGAGLALCDRDAVDVDGAFSQQLDVRDQPAVEAFLAAVGERFSSVDVLVNNAGGTFQAPFGDLSPRADEALVSENLLSAVWVTRAALPLLSDGASVINITTIEACRAAPGFALYAAAKAGLENLTKSLALELGGRGIRVNAIAPDVIETPGIGPLGEPRTPLPVKGSPGDVAGVALFLASPLSAFVTGATIPVDGGNHAAAGWRRDETGQWVL